MTVKPLWILFGAILSGGARGQTLIPPEQGRVALLPSDAAVLKSEELKRDMGCSIKLVPPELGFDFSFHAGYELRIPMHELEGSGTTLTAIVRVAGVGSPEDPVYLSQKWEVPQIGEGASGHADLRGSFLLGEGSYTVEWLVRDRVDRYCSARWQVLAERRLKDRPVAMRLASGAVEADPADPFAPEPPVSRDARELPHALLLLHVASQRAGAAGLSAAESGAITAMLRNAARDPRIGRFTLIAFNLDQGREILREAGVLQIDLPRLGEAIRKMNLGTVELQRLTEKNREANFLGQLLSDEIEAVSPSMVVLIGAKTKVESVTLDRSLRPRENPQPPIVYLSYTTDPNANPFRDVAGAVVKAWKGSEYTISRPRDLAAAWSDIMSRVCPKAPPILTPVRAR